MVAAKASSSSTMEDNIPSTKRNRRSQTNDKHKWPQHPKIQNMEQRDKAYLRVAGFGIKKKEEKAPVVKVDLMSPELHFGRNLGSTDQRKRHKAVHKLKTFLKAASSINDDNDATAAKNSNASGLSELDLLKLWKALWYTLYMADKVAVQDELSRHLAELLWCVAGTPEEDEYAGQAYLQMCMVEEEEEYDDEQMDEEKTGDEDDDDDDEDVVMEEVANMLDNDDHDDDDGSSDSQSDSEGQDGQETEENVMSNNPDNGNDGDDDEEQEDEVDSMQVRHCRGAHLASLFIRTFLRTLRREWGQMDKYRVDKFYTLMRLYVHEIFEYMASRHWNLGIIRLFNDALFEEVLKNLPNGLRYHLIDISLDELAKVNATAPLPLTEATFLDVLEPYLAMCQTGADDDTVQHRVVESILSKFLDEYSVVSDNAINEEVEEEKAGEEETPSEDKSSSSSSTIFLEVHVGTVSQFIFELASDPATRDRYRESLYEMHKKYARRLKKVGKDVELDEEHGGQQLDTIEGFSMDDQSDNQSDDEGHATITEESTEQTIPEEEGTQEQTPVRPTKESKKTKKNKKNKRVSTSDDSTTTESSQTKPNKRSKKAKTDRIEDEEVVISLSTQSKAKLDLSKAKQASKQAKEDATFAKEVPSGSSLRTRKVKFGQVNRSKSYKSSMKALRTTEPPNTLVTTPEKSILLKRKLAKRTKPKRKASRKKAANYF